MVAIIVSRMNDGVAQLSWLTGKDLILDPKPRTDYIINITDEIKNVGTLAEKVYWFVEMKQRACKSDEFKIRISFSFTGAVLEYEQKAQLDKDQRFELYKRTIVMLVECLESSYPDGKYEYLYEDEDVDKEDFGFEYPTVMQ